MPKRKQNNEGIEYGVHPAYWINCRDYPIDEDIKGIIEFFVWYGPFEGVSAKEKCLKEYGWDTNAPKKTGYLTKRILECSDLVDNETLFVANKLNEMKNLFIEASMPSNFWEIHSRNRIAILISQNFLISIFKAIRNSFAHGRFAVLNCEEGDFFALENGKTTSGGKFETKARIVIKKSTLLDWIDIIKNESSIEKQLKRDLEEQIEKEIFELVDSYEIQSQEMFFNLLKKDESSIKRVLSNMKNKSITYDRKLHRWVRTV